MQLLEVEVTNGLFGTLTLPDREGYDQNKLPGVLLVHGYGTDRNEVANVYGDLAESLCSNKIVSLRIDMRGFGKSIKTEANPNGLNIEEITVDTLIEDVMAAFQYLLQHPLLDSDRIGVCGYSLGGAVVWLASAMQKKSEGLYSAWTDPYKAMVLIAPVGDFGADFLKVFNIPQAQSEEMKHSSEIYTFDLGWRTVKVKGALFASFDEYTPKLAVSSYHGAFFTIVGSQDTIVGDHGKEYVERCPSHQKNYLCIDGADHIFHAFEHDKSTMNRVLEETTSWFTNNL